VLILGHSQLLRLAAVVVFSVALCGTLSAQRFGAITGTVTDSSGAVVPSATVKITDEEASIFRETQTDAHGYYIFPSVPPATYTLTVSATGFAPSVRRGVLLEVDQSITTDVTISVQEAQQNITVTAASVGVNTSSSTMTEVVDQRRLVDLPLNGRNAAALSLITAGVVQAPAEDADQGGSKTFPGAVTVSANGARQNQTSYLMDGASNNDIYTNVNLPFPAPDALEEFSVQTSNYSAKYGGNAGGVVNVVTKSGTNELHGDGFAFNRNAVFDARNFFADTRDQLKRNQFGATLGGPVIFPHLYNGRNATFFFVEYQGTRIRETNPGQNSYVPTQDELRGDFSAMLTASNPNNPVGAATIVDDPVTGQPFPGNLIPLNRFDPAAVALTKHLPASAGNGLVFYGAPTSQRYDEILSRIDHNISNADRLSVRYFFDRFYNSPYLEETNYLNNSGFAVIDSQTAMLGETHLFRPSLLNDLHISFGREVASRGPASGSISAADLGVNLYQPPGPHILENLDVAGFFGISQKDPAAFTRNQYGLGDSLSWVHGPHSFMFGVDVHRALVIIRNAYGQYGEFAFTPDYTNDALASFLLGKMYSFSQGNGESKDNRINIFGLFAQDDYHVSNKLTLNLGIRYDPFFPWKETKGRVEQFSPAAYHADQTSQVFINAPPGLLFPGDPGVPKYGILGSFKNFAPRVGFAYDVTGHGTTSIRGGLGMFYDSVQSGFINNSFVDVTPFSTQVLLTVPAGPFSNPYLGITNPFPAPSPPPKNIAFPLPLTVMTYDPGNGERFQTPVAYDWNLTIEHRLAADWLLRVAYVGSHASHLLEETELSPAVYIPGSTLGPDQRRLFQNYGAIAQASMDINSNFNSLQVALQKRFAHNFTLLTNYTWSKSIDDLPYGSLISTLSTPSAGSPSSASPIPWYLPGRHQFDRGPSEFDHPQRLVATFVWDLPKLKGAPSVVRYIAGEWELTGMFTAQSGGPVTVLAGVDESGTALGEDRGVVLSPKVYGPGACGHSAPCVNDLNPGAFALPAPGTYGNVGKDALRGPNLIEYDGGLFKEIPLHKERVQLQFRAEFFNLFNRANFFNPGQTSAGFVGFVPGQTEPATISGAGFGSILGSYDPRIGQLALKLRF